jgi:hypothetical protein
VSLEASVGTHDERINERRLTEITMTTTLKLRRTATAFALTLSIGAVAQAHTLRSVAEAGGCRFTGYGRARTATNSRQLHPAPTNPTLAAKAAVTQTRNVYG